MNGEIALDTSAAIRFLNDVWIAAQCIEHRWVLVTDDTDLDDVDGLILEHWGIAEQNYELPIHPHP